MAPGGPPQRTVRSGAGEKAERRLGMIAGGLVTPNRAETRFGVPIRSISTAHRADHNSTKCAEVRMIGPAPESRAIIVA